MRRHVLLLLLVFFLPTTCFGEGHFRLAEHYAPVIYQDVVCTKYGDYITRVDYDGDYVGNNNWNNLGYPNKARRLPAYVYYSVVETETHWFITYAFFHPGDDFECYEAGHVDRHENDLEGIILTVQKDGTPFGSLRLVQLQAHWWFYQYTPPGVAGIEKAEGDVEGTIGIDSLTHPRVYVEGGGHGIRHEDTGDAPSVIYRYGGHADDPDEVGYSEVHYDLLSIFSELWMRRHTSCCGSGNLFDNFGDYNGHRYSIINLGGRSFDGDDGAGDDKANAPWSWDDDNDGSDWKAGDWFMDPAAYDLRLNWSESFSTAYTIHPFIFSSLPDEIYNGRNGTTRLNVLNVLLNTFYVVRMVSVLPGQTMEINGSTLFVHRGAGIRSDGTLRIASVTTLHYTNIWGGEPEEVEYLAYLRRNDATNIGIRISGAIRMHSGGSVRFY